ncbi:MAG: flagellar basal body P-ring formation protein FlgA [Deltaproteobacteria bacterium]|nr:flagellar basal body P-ring formation protein FlgA [Deltaproteobacteria bacterium]
MHRKKIKFFSFSLIATLVLLALGHVSHAGELRIWIREKATVTGDTIRLGDIATFSPEQDGRVPGLRERKVAAAPAPGRDLALNSRFLIYRLSSLMGGDQQVRVKVPQNLLVHRDGQVISAKKMTDIFKQYVFSHAPWDRKEMELERVRVPGPVTLPCGRLSWEVQGRMGGDFVGDISLVLSFSVNGRVYKKVPATGRILVTRRVIKTARKIRKGEMIGPRDLVEVTEKSVRSGGTEVLSLEQVVGKRAARTLQMGQVVKREMVEIPPAVRKGDRVIIKAENGSVAVSTLGKVMEEGRSGEQIRVINISSGKEIFANVIGPGQVRVSF